MRATTIEQTIVDKLTAEFERVIGVERYPNNPTSYKLTHPKGVVLVRYNGTNFANPVGASANTGLQTGLMEWEFVIIMRNLRFDRNQEGVYELLERVRAAICALNIKGHGFFYQTNEDFLAESEGIWQYGMHFMLPRIYRRGVEEVDPEEN